MSNYRLINGELYSVDNELYHHGVKGMKWGVRRATSKYATSMQKAKSAYKNNKKQADSAYTRAGAEYERTTNGGRKSSRKADRAFDAAADKWTSDRKAAKFNYKQAKTQIKRDAVSQYSKKFDDAERASNLADKKWNQVSEQYKALGKTRVTRIINAARNKTDAAKQYSKVFDEASRMSDSADEKWREARAAYKETGRNYVERLFNNIKYGK